MKNRMAGIILIATGALLLGVGTFVYSTGNKKSAVSINNDEVNHGAIKNDSLLKVELNSSQLAFNDIKNEIPTKIEVKDNELEKVIEMAIADGVLTANERELIKKTAISKGVDYVAVLDDVEKRVELLEIDSETKLVNLKEKNGIDFEKFIVQKFDKRVLKLKNGLAINI